MYQLTGGMVPKTNAHLSTAIQIYWQHTRSVGETARVTHEEVTLPNWSHLNDTALLKEALTAMHTRAEIQQSIRAARDRWQQIADEQRRN